MAALCTLALALSAAGCGKGSEARGDDARVDAGVATQVVPVEVARARSGDISQTIQSTANVEARHANVLVAEASGIIDSVLVEEGDTVKDGQLLATIRNPELSIAQGTAAANVRRVKQEMANLEPLLAKGYVPRQGYEELEAQLTQANDQLARLRHQIGNLKARAPLGGVIARRSVQPGQQVSVGTELFYVVDPSELVAVVHVPERSLGKIREGAEAYVVSDALGGARFVGRLSLINPVVDPQTGTVKVTVDVADRPEGKSDPGLRLRPGMFVNVHIVTARRQGAVLVPKRAVVYEDNQPYVFTVLDDGGETIARKIPVQLGFSEEARVEIARGVAAGAEVVVIGQAGLKDGTAVEPVASKTAAEGL